MAQVVKLALTTGPVREIPVSSNWTKSNLDAAYHLKAEELMKFYHLTAAEGSTFDSIVPGELGGYSRQRIYGRLDCWSARLALSKGYARHRVFFANEAAAIAAGYRPCAKCMSERYRVWIKGGELDTPVYPWKALPKVPKPECRSPVSL